MGVSAANKHGSAAISEKAAGHYCTFTTSKVKERLKKSHKLHPGGLFEVLMITSLTSVFETPADSIGYGGCE